MTELLTNTWQGHIYAPFNTKKSENGIKRIFCSFFTVHTISDFSLEPFHPDLGHSGVNQLGGAFVNGRPLPESVNEFEI